MTPNDDYSGRTAPLTSKRCVLHIYSTNIDTEYFKRGIYSPFLPLQNAVCFINLTYLIPVLFTFYIQGVLKLKKNNSGAKRLRRAPQQGTPVRILRRAPVRWNSGRKQLYLVTTTFIPGFLLFGPRGSPLILRD